MEFIQNIDNNILEFIRLHMTSNFMNIFMPFVTRLGDWGLIWIIIAILFLISKKYRKSGLLLFGSLFLSLIIGSAILKPLFSRIRPFNVDQTVTLLIAKLMDYSFPSGHAMTSFASATIIYDANHKFGIFAFILSILISFSRLYLYVHYPSDVVVGMVIGILISVLEIYIVGLIIKRAKVINIEKK